MKRFLPLSILIFAFARLGISQITITKSDMPQPGDTLRVSMSNDSIGLPPPALTGAGITWDYSRLIPFSQTIDTFLSVPSTPFAYQLFFNDGFLYPAYKATVAQNGPNFPPLGPITVTQVVNYYKAQTANYESVGYGAYIDLIPTSVKDDTIDVIYNFPLNYGNADSCHSSSHTTIPAIGYYGQFQYRVNHVEGWGTLITPFGTFQTLKVKTMLFNFDSLYVDTFHIGFKTPLLQQIQYKWLANGQHIPVLQINETPGVPVQQYIYRDSIRSTLGVGELRTNSEVVRVYPNPSNGQFTFQSSGVSGQSSVEVYNELGQQVYSAKYPLSPSERFSRAGTANYSLDLSAQPNGIYFYRVLSQTGNLLGDGKLIIQK